MSGSLNSHKNFGFSGFVISSAKYEDKPIHDDLSEGSGHVSIGGVIPFLHPPPNLKPPINTFWYLSSIT